MKLLIPPPIVALLCGLLMWFVSGQFPAARAAFPLQDMLAYALIAAGISLDLVSILAFLRARTTVTPLAPEKASSLVVGGLYRFSRNPMYLGLLFILSGAAVWFGVLANLAVIIGFVAYITAFQIKPEEERLSEIFGQEYRDYQRQVRRWL